MRSHGRLAAVQAMAAMFASLAPGLLRAGQPDRFAAVAPRMAEMTRKQTGALNARPGMPWGLGFCVVEDPTELAANSVLSTGSFGHGGAFSTRSWADPSRNLIWIVMFQRDGKGSPDNSDVRIAFQEAAAKGVGL